MLLDGKKPARPNQIALIKQIQTALEKYDVVGVNAPPGWGKTYVSRALQLAHGKCDIICSSNHLIDQFCRDYPELPAVKGRQNYETSKEYQTARTLAGRSPHAVFNPLSALFTLPRETRSVGLTIVDEAHTLGEILRSAASVTFDTNKANIPSDCKTEYDLVLWAKRRFADLQTKVFSESASPALVAEFEKVGAVFYSVVGHERDSIFKIYRGHRVLRGRRIDTLSVAALLCPQSVLNRLFGDSKVVLLSGSLTQAETEFLAAGRSFTWISLPYLAPPENRPVYVRSVPKETRRDIPTLARQIRQIYNEFNQEPTLVHVTYADQELFAKELSDLSPLTNTPKSKLKTEQKFRKQGGIWLASGCAEGIDLSYDSCRNVIIPVLQFPNKGELYVQKRLGMVGGHAWYALKTLENTVQRLGRGVRGHDDYCRNFIIDPYFPQLWSQYQSQFQSLNIIWGQ